nr:hypothetical protein Iba_chr12dCG15880 [Ipomoea batatas]
MALVTGGVAGGSEANRINLQIITDRPEATRMWFAIEQIEPECLWSWRYNGVEVVGEARKESYDDISVLSRTAIARCYGYLGIIIENEIGYPVKGAQVEKWQIDEVLPFLFDDWFYDTYLNSEVTDQDFLKPPTLTYHWPNVINLHGSTTVQVKHPIQISRILTSRKFPRQPASLSEGNDPFYIPFLHTGKDMP